MKNEVFVEWCNRALAILYNVDDNEAGGDEEGAEYPVEPNEEKPGI